MQIQGLLMGLALFQWHCDLKHSGVASGDGASETVDSGSDSVVQGDAAETENSSADTETPAISAGPHCAKTTDFVCESGFICQVRLEQIAATGSDQCSCSDGTKYCCIETAQSTCLKICYSDSDCSEGLDCIKGELPGVPHDYAACGDMPCDWVLNGYCTGQQIVL